MLKLMTTTAIAMACALSVQAQEISYNISTDGYAGTTLLPSGMSSQAQVAISGFGSGGVVVANSGLNLNMTPDFDSDAATDFVYWPEDSDINGELSVENDRSVEVSGVLSGVGTVAGVGSTTTTYDAQMIAGSDVSNELSGDLFGEDVEVTLTQDMTGLARLAGESTSTAGFQMAGQDAKFIGELGTTVGGDFTALAFFDTDNDLDADDFFDGGPEDVDFEIESDGASGIVIDANVDDINLAVASLGGGTMLLQGENDDIFEGGTLLTNKGEFNLAVDFFDDFDG